MRNNHEIDYRIVGEEMQYVEIELDPNETAVAESGSFMMMEYRCKPFLVMEAKAREAGC